MNKRIPLAGLVAGVVYFIWLSIAHIATPLGMVGVSEIPNEASVLVAMKANMPAPGLYFYPGMGVAPTASKEEKAAAMQRMGEKMAAGPWGILIYHPNGTAALNPHQLGTELISNIIQGLLLCWLIAQTSLVSMSGRVAFATVVGIVAAMATNVSYWNWYGFPTNYTAAYMITAIIGYVLMGIVAASLLRPRAAR